MKNQNRKTFKISYFVGGLQKTAVVDPNDIFIISQEENDRLEKARSFTFRELFSLQENSAKDNIATILASMLTEVTKENKVEIKEKMREVILKNIERVTTIVMNDLVSYSESK